MDVETNPGLRRPVSTVCRLLCSDVQGQAGNLSDQTVASTRHNILLCSETFVSYVSLVRVAVQIRSHCLVVQRQDASGPSDGCIHIRDGYGAFRPLKFECGCCEMLVSMLQTIIVEMLAKCWSARGGTLYLLITDVPDLVRVAVVVPIGNSDHSSLSAVISMAQAVPNLCVSWKVFLKNQVNWNTVCGAMLDLPWRTFLSDNNPDEV